METVNELLRKNGFAFKKRFGQNFITDVNLLKSIVSLSGVDASSTVVEIGCGAGTLTRELSLVAKRVIAYEIDTDLKPVLAQTLSGCDNAEVVFKDFLRQNLTEFEKTVDEYVVVANLPYYITTPLITLFLEHGKKCKSLCVMVQEEVARRLCATENTADYGSVTAAVALRCNAEIVKYVSKEMFYPRPQVDSAVVKLTFVKDKIKVKSAAAYREVTRCAFSSRRKTLENNLINSFKLTREGASELLVTCGFDEKIRGETLSPAQFALLADLLVDKKILN